MTENSIRNVLKRMQNDFSVCSLETNLQPLKQTAFQIGAPDCTLCQGIGYTSGDYPVGHPSFGKMQICACRASSVEAQQKKHRIIQSNLTGYENMTFETFNTSGRGQLRSDQKFCLKLAYDMAHAFTTQFNGWLLLSGECGTGKTHLAAAIAAEALGRGLAIIFQPVPDLLDWLRSSYSGGGDSYEERFNTIRTVPLLVLDDLGTQNATEWTREKLYQILNTRYVNRLPTVITTNNSLRSLDRRIASRLEDPALVRRVEIIAPDYRKPMSDSSGMDELSSLHLLSNRTFANFNAHIPDHNNADGAAQLRTAYNHAFSFAEDPNGWLVFCGPNGCGKTHLAAAIANYRKEKLDNPLLLSVPDLLDFLRDTYSPQSAVSYSVRFERIRSAPLLVLDHLDTAYATPWAREKLFQILNYRYQTPLPTVITTILPVQEIDANIRSRILDYQVCRILSMFSVPMYRSNPEAAAMPKRISRKK